MPCPQSGLRGARRAGLAGPAIEATPETWCVDGRESERALGARGGLWEGYEACASTWKRRRVAGDTSCLMPPWAGPGAAREPQSAGQGATGDGVSFCVR